MGFTTAFLAGIWEYFGNILEQKGEYPGTFFALFDVMLKL